MEVKIKRILSTLIDYITILILLNYIPEMIKKLLNADFTVSIYIDSFSVVLSIIIIILKDLFFKNASLGKKIMRLKIICTNDNKLTSNVIIKRNIFTFMLLAAYPFCILINNRSIGDSLCNTAVIKSKTNIV